jgi:hypothetical protein
LTGQCFLTRLSPAFQGTQTNLGIQRDCGDQSNPQYFVEGRQDPVGGVIGFEIVQSPFFLFLGSFEFSSSGLFRLIRSFEFALSA